MKNGVMAADTERSFTHLTRCKPNLLIGIHDGDDDSNCGRNGRYLGRHKIVRNAVSAEIHVLTR